MADLLEKIEIEKKKYLDYCLKNEDKHIYIYGAGKQALPIASFLQRQNIVIDGFCVTDAKSNKKEILGLPVIQIDRILFEKETVAFIFGVRVQLNEEIEKIVRKQGFFEYLPASDLIRYFGEFGFNYYTNPMMDITTKLGCSVNCKYCPQEVFANAYMCDYDANKMLSLNDFKTCLHKLPLNTQIIFAGFAEPFLNPDCLEMIKYADECGYRISLFTTLCGIKMEEIDEIIKIDFDEFVLHVPDDEGYSIIPIDAEYKKKVAKFVTAKKKNGTNFVDYASAQGKISDEILQLLGEDIRTYVVLNDRAGNLNDDCLYGKKNLKGKVRCELCEDINHNVLLPDGRVLLCSNDWGMKHVLGNLIEQSYEEIINGDEAQKIRADMQNENGTYSLCRNCFQAIEC